MKLIDISGQRFGRLVVLGRGEKRPSNAGGSNWICRCDCGNEVTAVGSNLRRGMTRSCGCLAKEWSTSMGSNREFVDKRSESKVKHGHKRKDAATPEYKTWLGMKRRCYDVKYKDYPDWGGRGIRVCDRWNNSFEAFLADMGPRPSNQHSIDRQDSNKDYEPGNCRWATPQEQGGENRRGLIAVQIDGTLFASLKAACDAYDMPYTAVFDRVKRGIDVETAIKTPLRKLPNVRARESYLRKGLR